MGFLAQRGDVIEHDLLGQTAPGTYQRRSLHVLVTFFLQTSFVAVLPTEGMSILGRTLFSDRGTALFVSDPGLEGGRLG